MVAAATMAAMDIGEHLTLKEETILQASPQDTAYQLMVAKVLASDWHLHKLQETTCLQPQCGIRHKLDMSGGLVTYASDQNYLHKMGST